MSNDGVSPISVCHDLLNKRDFKSVKSYVEINRSVGIESLELDQAEAISDIMIAAESPFLDGFRDYYGMIRAKRFGPVEYDDIMTLCNVLDVKSNRYPYIKEAATYALRAWSMLYKADMKAEYDSAIYPYVSAGRNPQNHVSDSSGGGISIQGGGNGHGDVVVGSSLIPKEQNLGLGTKDEVIVVSDTESDDDGELMLRRREIPLKRQKKNQKK